MLADSTLAELTKSSPSQEALVRLAWPSLDVASKLRVIELVQGFGGVSTATPDWLHDLAMRDEAGIVRYWSARAFYFKHGPVQDPDPAKLVLFPTTAEDVKRTEQAQADSEPLVRAATNHPVSFLNYEGLEKLTQLERLQLIRESKDSFIEPFVDWLTKCVDENLLSDEEMTAALLEFYKSRPFIETQKHIYQEWGGYYAFSSGKALEKAWALAPRAGPMLRSYIANGMPLRFKEGLGGVHDETLDSLPEDLQQWLLYRQHNEPMAAAFIERVRANPERYGEKLVEEVRKRDAEPWDYSGPRNGEEIDRKHKHLSDSLEHAHKRLDKLQEGIRELYELVREALNRKRGISG